MTINCANRFNSPQVYPAFFSIRVERDWHRQACHSMQFLINNININPRQQLYMFCSVSTSVAFHLPPHHAWFIRLIYGRAVIEWTWLYCTSSCQLYQFLVLLTISHIIDCFVETILRERSSLSPYKLWWYM